MLATRTLLSKQTLAVLSRQPACFVHHGDYGNWGNTNIAVVSETYQYGTSGKTKSGGIIVIFESQPIPGFLRMWLVGWDWCPRGSIVSITPAELRTFHIIARTLHHAEIVTDSSVFSTMYHLSRNGARFQMFAPNQQQMHVMDHMRKQPASGENR